MGRAWKVEIGEKGPEGLWKYHVPHLPPCRLNARDAFAASFNRLSEELGSGPELFSGLATFLAGTNRGMFQGMLQNHWISTFGWHGIKRHRCKILLLGIKTHRCKLLRLVD